VSSRGRPAACVALRSTLVALVCLASACGSPVATPGEVVDAYFRNLARDPIRTLPLVTPEFHRRHALRVVTGADARAVAEGREPGHAAAALAVDRYELGWLAVQSRPDLARLAAGLGVQIGEPSESDGEATVVVHVAPRSAPPFEQRFSLVRSEPDPRWRIDAIEQVGVVPANAAAAFAAYPNEAARRALAAQRAR